TFHDYVNELRVIEVQNRLKTVDLSMYTITGVALECGFNSKATFNRLFKEHTGITPTSFLNQQRK
ncbi:MAG: helix-turn-helix domain-containing protein, partial [Bacteroidota bacterium]